MRWAPPSDKAMGFILWPLMPLFLIPIGLMIALIWIDGKIFPETDWHPWFAWRPVKLDQWPEQWVWLEWVDKYRPIAGGSSYYRTIGDHRFCRDDRVNYEGS